MREIGDRLRMVAGVLSARRDRANDETAASANGLPESAQAPRPEADRPSADTSVTGR